MNFTEQDLDNLSRLSRISITDAEKPKMLVDIEAILDYISEINEVSPLRDYAMPGESGTEEIFNVVREDIVIHETGSNTEAILANVPKVKDGYVEVAQVLK